MCRDLVVLLLMDDVCFGNLLIDRSGSVVARFSPAFPPEQREAAIEALL